MVGLGAGGGAAGGVVALEVCAPLLLLCWLCCWPDDNSDTSSSGKHPKKPVIGHGHDSGSRRRSSELLARRVASSAVSLHLPGTSGNSKESLSAHRSHEEIPCRRRSTHEVPGGQEGRYHSAPSVIDEVLHRRDWDRSTRELYIPLHPDTHVQRGPCPRSPSPEPDRRLACKKHYTNIKSSRNKINKESNKEDVKDTDATESIGNFYIGEARTEASMIGESREEIPELVLADDKIRSVYKAKDDKQSINESIKIKERPGADERRTSGSPLSFEEDVAGWSGADGYRRMFDLQLCGLEVDRSGATHRAPPDSPGRASLRSATCPPPSVALVGYEGAACYLLEPAPRPRARRPDPPAAWPRGAGAGGGAGGGGGGARARHASDGDILAPAHRPESGAFSESDLDLEPESEELPPPYHELRHQAAATRSHTETAI